MNEEKIVNESLEENYVLMDLERHIEPDSQNYESNLPENKNSVGSYFGINTHDPRLREAKRFSNIGCLFVNDANDVTYSGLAEDDRYAVLRTSNSVPRSASFPLFINKFGKNMGFDYILEILADKTKWCPVQYVSAYMSILGCCAAYMYEPFVKKYAPKIITLVMANVLNSPEANIRNFNKDKLAAIHTGLESLCKRLYSVKEVQSKMESFGLDVAILCINSDFLEIKLQGIKNISELCKKARTRELYFLDENSLIERLREQRVLEGILKGHVQLISKSSEIMRLLLTKDSANSQDLDLIWNSIKKGDYETKTSLFSKLSDITWELSQEQIEFLMEKIETSETKSLTIEEMEFTSKICYSVRHKLSQEAISKVMSMGCRVFWRAMCDETGLNPEVSKKASQKLSSIFQCNSKLDTKGTPRLEFVETVVDEACDNIKNNKFVLQSLKVIKKVLEKYDCSRSEITQKLVDHDLVNSILDNLTEFKKNLKAKYKSRSSRDITDATAEAEYPELSALRPTFVIEDDLNTCLTDKKFTFSQHISKRMSFLSSLLSHYEFDQEKIKGLLGKMWDELVVNSFTDTEGELFRRWFSGFTDKIIKQ